MRHKHKIICAQNHPLQERPVWRIIFHAVRPVGRCVGGAFTCAGSRVLAHPGAAAFLFFKQSIAQSAPLYKLFSAKITGIPPLECRAEKRIATGTVRPRGDTSEKFTLSFRDQFSYWPWESVIPLRKGRRERADVGIAPGGCFAGRQVREGRRAWSISAPQRRKFPMKKQTSESAPESCTEYSLLRN